MQMKLMKDWGHSIPRKIAFVHHNCPPLQSPQNLMLIVSASKTYNEEVSLWATQQMRRAITTGITRLVERLSL